MARTRKTAPKKIYTARASTSYYLDGVVTTLSLELPFFSALQQIAANENTSHDQVASKLISDAGPLAGADRAETVRIGIIRYFRNEATNTTRRTRRNSPLSGLTTNRIFQTHLIQVSKDRTEEWTMPKLYWDVLKEMGVGPAKPKQAFSVAELINRNTFAWSKSQLAVAVLKHVQASASKTEAARAKFPALAL